jgi:hypothetical protein
MSVHKNALGLIIGFLSFVGSAQAQVLTLPSETIGLTPLKGRVTSVETVNVLSSQSFAIGWASDTPNKEIKPPLKGK